MKDLILSRAPIWLQNAAISVFNRRQWWQRQGGDYRAWQDLCVRATSWSEEQWAEHQAGLLDAFLKHAVANSPHYSGIDPGQGLQAFPILEKDTLVTDLDRIKTIKDSEGVVSYTGGTTGASMKVIYTVSDVQKRFAMLDWFRGLSGWKLGRRTAWFSGKRVVRDKDLTNGICYRDDWLTKTRFFSTFHVNEKNFDTYWRSLIDFNPEFIVGFPSSLSEILTMAREKGLEYPHRVKAVFPTAETVLPYHRSLFHEMLGAETKDQYASSEGAPFIVECPCDRLHILPYSGIFEVVDAAGQPAREGELLVTAFHTHGTPIIRYRVGDRIVLAPESDQCACGWTFPIVDRIDGREADFVWSPQHGRINLGNLSNSTKGVAGIVKFRVLQKVPDAITVEVQCTSEFDDDAAKKFESELRQRTGDAMTIDLVRKDTLARAASGKFRIVENSLTPEQMRLGATP